MVPATSTRPRGRRTIRPHRAPRSLALPVHFLVLLATAACVSGPEAPSPAPAGSTVVRALMTQDPASLSLVGKVDVNGERLAVQLTDSLVQYDPSMRLLPRVAESWDWSDDHRTLTFRLRPGVRWHDGRPVTADDVVFTVELVRDPAVENPTFAAEFESLVSLDAPDARTVRAVYARALPDALEAWRVPLIPKHAAEPGVELLTGAFSRKPIGCGPFRFAGHRPGEEIVLDANDDYWDGRPSIDRLVFRIYPDQRTALQVLLAGGLETMIATPDLWLEAKRSERGERLVGFAYPRTSVWHVRWNVARAQFDDARVRRALIQALARRRFADAVVAGMADVAVTTYHPSLPWTDPTLRPWPYDPDVARRLLNDAGWRDTDGDGVRERGGVRLDFELMIVSSSQQLVDQTAAWLQQSWAEVGARAEIVKLEWARYRELRREGAFDAALGSVSTTVSPDQFVLYHSTAVEGGYNFGRFADPEVDRLLELGRTTFDPDERRGIYHALQRRLHELQPIGCLLHLQTPVLHDPRLRGMRPSPIDHFRTTEGPRVWTWDPAAPGD